MGAVAKPCVLLCSVCTLASSEIVVMSCCRGRAGSVGSEGGEAAMDATAAAVDVVTIKLREI